MKAYTDEEIAALNRMMDLIDKRNQYRVEIKQGGTNLYKKAPLTNKQKKVRQKNKTQRQSRKRNSK